MIQFLGPDSTTFFLERSAIIGLDEGREDSPHTLLLLSNGMTRLAFERRTNIIVRLMEHDAKQSLYT